ncbi:MAG: hypothetical protein F4213_05685 [Boseongicola sp. SB0677_bin_26]|nr:hypothetical protein [Boseongicola sp. SB0665_bin_10]MYG25498.1 hypothetical protein [Boseongicola sp. SB0677_bin_26]
MKEPKWPEIPWTLLGIMLGLVLVSALTLAARSEIERLREIDEIAVTCLEPVAETDGTTGCVIFASDEPAPITIEGMYDESESQ